MILAPLHGEGVHLTGQSPRARRPALDLDTLAKVLAEPGAGQPRGARPVDPDPMAHSWRTRYQKTAVIHKKRQQARHHKPMVFLLSFVVDCEFRRTFNQVVARSSRAGRTIFSMT